MADEKDITHAKAVADAIRSIDPAKAAEIDRAVLEAESGQRESLKVKMSIKYTLEKFNGEWTPDAKPVEVIEGEG